MTGRDYCVSFRLGPSRVLATLDASALGRFNARWPESNEFDIVRRCMDGLQQLMAAFPPGGDLLHARVTMRDATLVLEIDGLMP